METKILSKKIFAEILNDIRPSLLNDLDYLFDVYSTVVNGINLIFNKVSNYKFVPVNHVSVILYIINECSFNFKNKSKEKIEELKKDEEFSTALSSICCDKYLTNEQLNYKNFSFLNRFNIEISTLSLFLNFILNTINKIKVKDNVSELVQKLLGQAFRLNKCVIELLLNGSETEAFSTWRTLHENECILLVLAIYGKPLFKEYFKHMTYALAYRNQLPKEKADEIFVTIKKEMKEHNLQSKDMKKFIEYGYLYAIKDFDKMELKLNFRDGVEKAARLEEYNKIYELSSEITHSSPLLLLADKNYYFGITVKNLYESFFRLEDIFNMFSKEYTSKENYKNYIHLRNVYLTQLKVIYSNLFNKK